MRRDSFLLGSLAFLTISNTPVPVLADDAIQQLGALEKTTGGRLGVFAIDTQNSRTIAYRENERFPMCSTFKLLAVSAVLSRVDSGQEQLNRRIHYGKADIQEYAPIAREHLARGYMTVSELCAAAIEWSDNTAANLLLKILGGPQGVTRYVRTLGDTYTTLNRMEPELNDWRPGDTRDTTTPASMAADAQKILVGNVLSSDSRNALTGWLLASRTGTNLIRAGVPASWRVGDKTGLGGQHNRYGDSNTRNDVAILWPPYRPPIIVAAYLTGAQVPARQRDAALAQIGRIVSGAFGG